MDLNKNIIKSKTIEGYYNFSHEFSTISDDRDGLVYQELLDLLQDFEDRKIRLTVEVIKED